MACEDTNNVVTSRDTAIRCRSQLLCSRTKDNSLFSEICVFFYLNISKVNIVFTFIFVSDLYSYAIIYHLSLLKRTKRERNPETRLTENVNSKKYIT